MKYLLFIILLLFSVVVELTVSDLIAIGSITPHFSIIILAMVGFSQGRFRTTLVGFVVGLIQDLFGYGLIGLGALSKTILGFFFGQYSGSLKRNQAVVITIILFLADFMNNLIVRIVTGTGLSVVDALFTALYTASVGFIFFMFIPKRLWRAREVLEDYY